MSPINFIEHALNGRLTRKKVQRDDWKEGEYLEVWHIKISANQKHIGIQGEYHNPDP